MFGAVVYKLLVFISLLHVICMQYFPFLKNMPYCLGEQKKPNNI